MGWLHLDGSWLAFLANKVSLVVFSLLAIGELIADKLPVIPATSIAELKERLQPFVEAGVTRLQLEANVVFHDRFVEDDERIRTAVRNHRDHERLHHLNHRETRQRRPQRPA